MWRRIIAENPDLWEWVEQRWAKLTASLSGYGEAGEPTQEPGLGIDFEYQRQLARRRLEALAVARTMNLSEVDASAVEAFEPQELQHIS